MPIYEDEDANNQIGWQKPDWTKGAGLKKTGRADKMVGDGNLAGPITNLPHQKDDGPFQKPEWTSDVADMHKPTGDLAKPITNLPHDSHGKDKNLEFAKPEWTKNPNLANTKKGQALKQGAEIARPIGGIKAVNDN